MAWGDSSVLNSRGVVMLLASSLHTPCMLSTLSFLITPNTASVPFNQLQNLPSLFTVGKRKTIFHKIASEEWEFLWLTTEKFFMLFIIPIYCHLSTPLWSLSVCLSVYFRYMNCAPNKCAFTKGWVTNHLPWLAFMVIWLISKTSVLAHLQHCVASIQMLCRALNAVGHGSQQLSSQ